MVTTTLLNNSESRPEIRIAFQGEPGAYSEQAARQFFPTADLHVHPCATFESMFQALTKGLVDRAAVPIENSLAGTIHENLDLLLQHPSVTIVGEQDVCVRHCLLANPGVRLQDVRSVRSHFMALAQCKAYLHEQGLHPEVSYDTAGAARLLKKERCMDAAAIASKRAAQIYSLNILAEEIQDEPRNYTRFLIVARESVPYAPTLPSKTSIAFCLGSSPGLLCQALAVFRVTNIDLTKIESRHIQTVKNSLDIAARESQDSHSDTRWGYVFYVDIARHSEEKDVAVALNHLQEVTSFFRILGSYQAYVPDDETN